MKEIYEKVKKHPLMKGIEFNETDSIMLYVYLKDVEKCNRCLGLENCKMRTKGYTSILDKDRLQVSYTPCKYMIETGKINDIYLDNEMLPKRLARASLDDFKLEKSEGHRKAFLYASKFLSEIKNSSNNDNKLNGIYLYGENFKGKSYLLAAIANELKNRKVKTKYVDFPEFVRNIKGSSNKEDFLSIIKELETVNVLIIDSLGSEYMTEWIRDDILGPIVNSRYMNELPTLYASNFALDKLNIYLSNGTDSVKAFKITKTISESCETFKFS